MAQGGSGGGDDLAEGCGPEEQADGTDGGIPKVSELNSMGGGVPKVGEHAGSRRTPPADPAIPSPALSLHADE